jgi:hypothetical protein
MNLTKLNVETNMLTGISIEAIAYMAEKHPSISELRISNQRMAVGIEAERALANALSQNTNIRKLSHCFRETFVATYVDKYLQRNLDLVRRVRNSTSDPNADRKSIVESLHKAVPYPFPVNPIGSTSLSTTKSNEKDAVEEAVPTRRRAATTVERPTEVIEEAEPLISPRTRSASLATSTPVVTASPEVDDNTEKLSIQERLALLRKEKEYQSTVIPDSERMNMTVQERLSMLRKEKDHKVVEISDSEKVNVSDRISKLRNDAQVAFKASTSPTATNTTPGGKSPVKTSKISNLGQNIRLDGIGPNAKLPPKLLAKTQQTPQVIHDLKITVVKSTSDGNGDLKHVNSIII